MMAEECKDSKVPVTGCPWRRRKECARCGEMRPLPEYRRHNKAKDGHGAVCRSCRLRARYEREQQAGGELPPLEQWVRNYYATSSGARRVRINLTTRRLEALRFRGVISDLQLRAGLKYRECWEMSGVEQRQVADYGSRVGIGETSYGMPATERQAHYRHQLRRADEALGVYYQRVAVLVCAEDETLAGLASRCGYHGQERARINFGKRVLTEALDVLVDHWGLRPSGHGRRRHPSAWRGEGAELAVLPETWEE